MSSSQKQRNALAALIKIVEPHWGKPDSLEAVQDSGALLAWWLDPAGTSSGEKPLH